MVLMILLVCSLDFVISSIAWIMSFRWWSTFFRMVEASSIICLALSMFSAFCLEVADISSKEAEVSSIAAA